MEIQKNKKGFTLVELLAVIVVLAIVMLIALQAVLPRMEEARKSVFAIEANGAIKSAQTYFMNKSLTGASGFPSVDGADHSACVDISTLISEGYSDLGAKSYSGKVTVTKQGALYLYKVWLKKDDVLMVVGKGTAGEGTNQYNEDITMEMVDGYTSAGWTNSTCTTSSTT